MKKIAVLYAGLLRNDYERCLRSFQKNVVESNPEIKFDYYLCFWNSDPIKKAIKLFNPKSYVVINYKKIKKMFLSSDFKHVFDLLHASSLGNRKKQILNSFLMQMYALKICNDNFLKTCSDNYEYVFKNRYDFIYNEPISIPKIEDNFLHTLRKQGTFIFVDNICIGVPQTVAVYMNSYNSLINKNFLSTKPKTRNLPIDEYGFTRSRKENFELPFISPERVFEEHLFINKIKFVKTLDWNTWAINRKPIPPIMLNPAFGTRKIEIPEGRNTITEMIAKHIEQSMEIK